jgi:hypothetical protein
MDIIDSDPEIDFDHLNQYVGGDISLTKEIFGLFKNQVEMWSKALFADADDEVWSGMTTHALRPVKSPLNKSSTVLASL